MMRMEWIWNKSSVTRMDDIQIGMGQSILHKLKIMTRSYDCYVLIRKNDIIIYLPHLLSLLHLYRHPSFHCQCWSAKSRSVEESGWGHEPWKRGISALLKIIGKAIYYIFLTSNAELHSHRSNSWHYSSQSNSYVWWSQPQWSAIAQDTFYFKV